MVILKNSIVYEKSFILAKSIVRLYSKIIKTQKEYALSKQLLRSGTSIGANLAEANGSISIPDFSAKVSIAYKESLETKYWLTLLSETNYIDKMEATDLVKRTDEISAMLFAILKKTRFNK